MQWTFRDCIRVQEQSVIAHPGAHLLYYQPMRALCNDERFTGLRSSPEKAAVC